MKNNLILVFLIIFFTQNDLSAENIFIESKNISVDKQSQISIFENDVLIKTDDNKTINSDFAEYNKSTGNIKLKGNVTAIDDKNNKIETQKAEYNDEKKIFKSLGPTKIITSDKYEINGEDIVLNNKLNTLFSNQKANISDLDNNKISLKNFEYSTKDNIFKSIGDIKINDKMNNIYEFSQIYIDTKKKEIVGTDIKAFLNDDRFKVNINNKPRIFANTIKINNEKSSFGKSNFTICNYRKNNKCPPWSIKAKKMLHDNKKKTVYYDNAVIQIYDVPIFFIPKLSHPDPTVDRRSGFLIPSFSDTKNLGAGISIPYFWALNNDKNLTLTNKLFANENPLFLGEYHQAFKNSNLLTDFGFTEGYKKTSNKKRAGDRSHFFSKFVKNFNFSENSESTLNLSVQNVSDNKYLKLYKIESNLVDYNSNTLENSLDFTHQDENIFFGFNTSVFETLNDSYNDKYEYILPDITINKNLISDSSLGLLDLQTNFKVHNYDTNKLSKFLVNDLFWSSNETSFSSGINGKILSNLKNINYETKNIDFYKEETTNEIFGAVGYLSNIDLRKNIGSSTHFLNPKFLLRYAPGSMRKDHDGFRLNPINAFSLNRLNNINNFETGLSGTLGFDYKIKKNTSDLNFSIAQIFNKKENKQMHSKTSLDEKVSDLVASTNYRVSDKISLDYNFSIDQNFKELNYNEFGASLNLNPLKINFNYLEEDKHIGDQEYFKTKIDLAKGNNGIFSFETKRNLITNSSEFYNLSYEYLNDCLRAGLVYRREFYTDSELEPENSLMFKITLTPFGDINSPSFNK